MMYAVCTCVSKIAPLPTLVLLSMRTTAGRACLTISLNSAAGDVVGVVVGRRVGVGLRVGIGRGVAVGVGATVGIGVGVGTGVAVGCRIRLCRYATKVASGVGVGVGMAATVAAIRASTVASTSGVGGGVGVTVGAAACVASIPATTVALMSGIGVGVSVGKAADTAACTVAPKFGMAVGAEAGLSPAQATVKSSVKHRTIEIRIFITALLDAKAQRRNDAMNTFDDIASLRLCVNPISHFPTAAAGLIIG